MYLYVWADLNLSAVIDMNWVWRGLFFHVLCRCDMPFLEKLADITVSGRHVGDMSATFPAKVVGDEEVVIDGNEEEDVDAANDGLGDVVPVLAIEMLVALNDKEENGAVASVQDNEDILDENPSQQ